MILVLTYAKVCSTSITELLTRYFPGEVFNSHGVGAWLHDPLAAALVAQDVSPAEAPLFHTEVEDVMRRLAQAMEVGEQITIISGVRDPIARSLSVAIQNLETDFSDCLGLTEEATAHLLAARVADLWLRDTPDGDPHRTYLERMIRAPLFWFQEEIEKSFGFNLQAHVFDQKRGYTILKKDNLRLLLFRHEDAPTAIENGLLELFPGIDFCLPHSNDSTQKSTGGIYWYLKRFFSLPRPMLQAIYGNPSIASFYSDDEIASAVDRWTEDVSIVLATPRVNFLATVFIPMRNHACWIGQQLDSLLRQWRSDVELLLIDDGSDDGGMAVALNKLVDRPDVAATVMRNNQPVGHGLLANLATCSDANIFIQADSDDIALPGRLDTIIAHFSRYPNCRLLTSNAVLLSEAGIPISLYGREMVDEVFSDPIALADRQGQACWLGATSAYHRSVLEGFPQLDPELFPYGLDLVTGLRATLLGSHHYLARPLVGWRQHSRNSHRISGWVAENLAGREHAAALNLMVCTQRLRDIAWLRSQGKLAPVQAAATEERWQRDLMVQMDHWIRLRNRLTGSTAAPTPPSSAVPEGDHAYVPAIPPIPTLLRGQECHMVGGKGAIFSQWHGFHDQEKSWIWTERQAIIVLRISDPEAQRLVVTLSGLPCLHQQSVCLSLNFAPPVQFKLIASQPKSVTLALPRFEERQDGLVTLWIEAPSALRPVSMDSHSSDNRLLGTALHAVCVL